MSVSVNFQELRFCCSSSISGSRIWNFTENIVLLYFLRCSIKLSWLVLRPAVYSTSTWLYGQILIFFEVLRSKSLLDLGALGLHTALLSLPRGTGQHCEAELLLEVAFVLCRKHLHFQAFMLTFQFGLFPTARSSCVTCHTSAAKKTSLYPLLTEGKVPHCCVGKK